MDAAESARIGTLAKKATATATEARKVVVAAGSRADADAIYMRMVVVTRDLIAALSGVLRARREPVLRMWVDDVVAALWDIASAMSILGTFLLSKDPVDFGQRGSSQTDTYTTMVRATLRAALGPGIVMVAHGFYDERMHRVYAELLRVAQAQSYEVTRGRVRDNMSSLIAQFEALRTRLREKEKAHASAVRGHMRRADLAIQEAEELLTRPGPSTQKQQQLRTMYQRLAGLATDTAIVLGIFILPGKLDKASDLRAVATFIARMRNLVHTMGRVGRVAFGTSAPPLGTVPAVAPGNRIKTMRAIFRAVLMPGEAVAAYGIFSQRLWTLYLRLETYLRANPRLAERYEPQLTQIHHLLSRMAVTRAKRTRDLPEVHLAPPGIEPQAGSETETESESETVPSISPRVMEAYQAYRHTRDRLRAMAQKGETVPPAQWGTLIQTNAQLINAILDLLKIRVIPTLAPPQTLAVADQMWRMLDELSRDAATMYLRGPRGKGIELFATGGSVDRRAQLRILLNVWTVKRAGVGEWSAGDTAYFVVAIKALWHEGYLTDPDIYYREILVMEAIREYILARPDRGGSAVGTAELLRRDGPFSSDPTGTMPARAMVNAMKLIHMPQVWKDPAATAQALQNAMALERRILQAQGGEADLRLLAFVTLLLKAVEQRERIQPSAVLTAKRQEIAAERARLVRLRSTEAIAPMVGPSTKLIGDRTASWTARGILAVTWNTAGAATRKSRRGWQTSPSGKAWAHWLRKRVGAMTEPPVLVTLALQEWNTHNEFPEAFGDWLEAAAGSNTRYLRYPFKLTTSLRFFKRDFSQNLTVYVRADLAAARVMTPRKAGSVCFGASKTCTKGSLVVRTAVPDDVTGPLYIVASHFPFGGPENVKGRDRAYRKTVKAVPALERDPNAFVLWMGDLNYRRQGSNGTDQLTEEMRAGRVFRGFREGVDGGGPQFGPTCKMLPLPKDGVRRRDWIRKRTQGGAYDPKRRPSHCDRILVRNGKSAGTGTLVIKQYEAVVAGTLESDHNAVSATVMYT